MAALTPDRWKAKVRSDLNDNEDKTLRAVIKNTALAVVRAAPVASGSLKNSVRTLRPIRSKGAVTAGVRVSRFYSRYVDQGTVRQRGQEFFEPAVANVATALSRKLTKDVRAAFSVSMAMNRK